MPEKKDRFLVPLEKLSDSFCYTLCLKESEQTKNILLLRYLSWSSPLHTLLSRECSKTSTNPCGWWIAFHSTSPFLQTQCRKPLPSLIEISMKNILTDYISYFQAFTGKPCHVTCVRSSSILSPSIRTGSPEAIFAIAHKLISILYIENYSVDGVNEMVFPI